MNPLCKLGMHAWKFKYQVVVPVEYCSRCDTPRNPLCAELMLVEQELWKEVTELDFLEFTSVREAQDYVLTELLRRAGFGSVEEYYYETIGYQFTTFTMPWRMPKVPQTALDRAICLAIEREARARGE